MIQLQCIALKYSKKYSIQSWILKISLEKKSPFNFKIIYCFIQIISLKYFSIWFSLHLNVSKIHVKIYFVWNQYTFFLTVFILSHSYFYFIYFIPFFSLLHFIPYYFILFVFKISIIFNSFCFHLKFIQFSLHSYVKLVIFMPVLLLLACLSSYLYEQCTKWTLISDTPKFFLLQIIFISFHLFCISSQLNQIKILFPFNSFAATFSNSFRYILTYLFFSFNVDIGCSFYLSCYCCCLPYSIELPIAVYACLHFVAFNSIIHSLRVDAVAAFPSFVCTHSL